MLVVNPTDHSFRVQWFCFIEKMRLLVRLCKVISVASVIIFS